MAVLPEKATAPLKKMASGGEMRKTVIIQACKRRRPARIIASSHCLGSWAVVTRLASA